MGYFAQHADVCSSRVEVAIIWMIERDIASTLTPISDEITEYSVQIEIHKLALDALTMRVEVVKIQDVTTMKADIIEVHIDVDKMKPTYMPILISTTKIP